MSGFARYESYKDSDVEWLGEIPEHWPLQTIRAVTTLKSEKNRPDLQVLSVYREFGVILKDSRDDNHNATSLDTASYKAVNVGDLVVNKMKAWQGSMGISEHHGIVSPAYITCTVDSAKVAAKFLHYLLRSKSYIGIYNALSYGVRVGQWDMHYDDFKKIPIPLPSVPEQTRIANFLDQKTAEIDEAIAKKQRLIDLLQEQKAILINQAVTKGLNPDAPMRDSGVEWIGEIPAHWEVAPNRYIFSEQTARSIRGEETHLSMSQRLGLIPSSELDVLTLQSESYEGAKLCKQGDLVLNRLKAHLAVFSVAPSDGLVSADYAVYRLNNPDDVPKYFEALFKKNEYLGEFNRKVRGIVVGFYRLYSDEFKAIPCLHPPAEEQMEIAAHIDQIQNHVKAAVRCIENEINSMHELRSILIANAVTGKIKI